MIGKTISHYRILEKLGEGGMGVVYKAEDTKLKRTVALKFLPHQRSQAEEEKKRFIYEARAASALDHPNICTIYEIDETEDGQMFIAMACYEGEILKDKTQRGPLKVEDAIDISVQIAQGLEKAHQKEIIHRDIKPANILITTDGVVKILDFGLAKLAGRTVLTKEGTTLGTVTYMSPEQARGEVVDHRTDIWSLGVVLYEMLTGQNPFKGDYEQAVVYSIMNEEAEPVTALRTGVPMELERIIRKALAKEPSERYQGTADLLVDLRKVKQESHAGMIPVGKDISKGKSRRALIFAIPGFILFMVIMAISGWFLFGKKPKPIEPIRKAGGKPALAIVYFENNTGDKELDHWRNALAELMITDISQSKHIRVLSGDRLFNIFKKLNLLETRKYSSEDLSKIAALGRVDHILRGNFVKAGEKFRINISLQRADTEEIMSSSSVEGTGEESIFTMVDELTKRVKVSFKLSADEIASDIDQDIRMITTSSPEAYKYYSKGMRYLSQGDYRKTISFIERAVAIDPEFATAYEMMSWAYHNMGYSSEYNQYTQKALEFSDRVSERERYHIQGSFYFQSEETYDKAIAAYQKLLQLYPDDMVGNNLLGYLYLFLEEWDKAIERFEVNVQNRVEAFYSYHNLASAYVGKGLYDRARKVDEYYLNTVSDHFEIRTQLASNYLIQREYDLALVEADKAFALEPTNIWHFRLKGYIYHCKGDLVKAEKEFQRLQNVEEGIAKLYAKDGLGALYLLQGEFKKSEEQFKEDIELAEALGDMGWKSELHRYLAYIHLKSDHPEEALNECNKAWNSAVEAEDLPRQRRALYFKGLTYLEMKSMDEAQRTADELNELIDQGLNKKVMRYYHLLMGQIELARSNSSRALEYFTQALSLLHSQQWWPNFNDQAIFIAPLAWAHYKKGDLERASEEYERITSLTLGRLYFGDIYARSFYMLGQIYQEKGWKGKAIEHYNRFIELWNDCDPRFQPMVENAVKRVKELEGEK